MKITINVKSNRYAINIYDRDNRLASVSLKVTRRGVKIHDDMDLITQLRYAGFSEDMLSAVDDIEMAVWDIMDNLNSDWP